MEGFECYTTRRVSPIQLGGGLDDERSQDTGDLYEVRIIDNDRNTYQEVIEISMLALGISEEEAFAIAWEVDHRGSCAVARARRDTAEAVADVIRVIGIEVQVNRLGSDA